MDNIVYTALSRYYNVLDKLGYMSADHIYKLLVLIFYRDFIYNDYNGLISEDDYCCINKVLNCLFGSTCLIPYPDYLKMGTLSIGAMTEIAQRLKNLEETEVVMPMSDVTTTETSDISIVVEDD